VLDDEALAAKPGEIRGGGSGRHSQHSRNAVDGHGGFAAQQGVDLPGEVSEAWAGEEIVAGVGEFVLE
jgi:hypothetical protein